MNPQAALSAAKRYFEDRNGVRHIALREFDNADGTGVGWAPGSAAWSFPGTSYRRIRARTFMPAGWLTARYRIWWTGAASPGSAAEQIRWQMRNEHVNGEGEVDGTANQSTLWTQLPNDITASEVRTTAFDTFTVAHAKVYRVLFQRRGDDATNDTYAGAATLIGVTLERVT